jgi:hypothetical protein
LASAGVIATGAMIASAVTAKAVRKVRCFMSAVLVLATEPAAQTDTDVAAFRMSRIRIRNDRAE